jgi:hypothetical protein
LGPILFLCHINDLPDAVKSQVRLFADNCLLYRPINSQKDNDILQQDLKNLDTWAENWGMRINAKKCYILSIKQKISTLFLKWPHIRTSQKQPILRPSNFRGHEVVITYQQYCKKSQLNLGLPKKKLEIQSQKLQKDRIYHLSKIHNGLWRYNLGPISPNRR